MIVNILGYMHGFVWKLSSVFCKILFLVVLVPKFSAGVYAEYYYTLTVGLIGGRIFSFGFHDQLPLDIKGNKDAAEKYLIGFELFACLSVIVVCLVLVLRASSFLIPVFMVVIVLDAMLTGLVRGLDTGLYERQLNLPWIVYLLLVFSFSGSELFGLVALLIVSYLISIIYVYIISFQKSAYYSASNRLDFFSIFIPWIVVARRGIVKMVYELLLVFCMRSLIVLSKLAKGVVLSDSLALALTLAEGGWQMGMVLVNRHYERYIRFGPLIKSRITNSLIVLMFMAVGSSVAMMLCLMADFSIFQKILWSDLAVGLFFFSMLAVLLDVRNGYWVQSNDKNQGLVLLAMFAAAQFFLVKEFDYQAVAAINSAAMLFIYLLCLIFLWNKRNDRNVEDSQ